MTIAFTCPNCQKGMRLKDELAGKKGRCPACKKIITVPAPVAAPPAAEIEDLAASVFADEPAAAPVVEQKTVDFNCPQCDEPIQLPASVAGKQAPCPCCRKIIKVPQIAKTAPKDWRESAPRGPSGARQNLETPALEGAWTPAGAPAAVSTQALREAGVIKEQREPWTWRQRIIWIGGPLTLSLVVLYVAYAGWGSWGRKSEARAVEQALKLATGAEARPFPLEAKAEIARAGGEYFLHSAQPTAATTDRAVKLLREARTALMNPNSNQRDVLLLELALTQAELGSAKPDELDRGTRLSWNETKKELEQTLSKMPASELRPLALREVSQKLVERGAPTPIIEALTLTVAKDAQPEAQALAGLELLRTDPKAAAKLASQALGALIPLPGAVAKPPPPPAALIALVLALKDPKIAAPQLTDDTNVVLGYIEGKARLGDVNGARQLIGNLTTPPARMQGLLTLAELQLREQAFAAQPDVTEAAKIVTEGELRGKYVSPWLLLRLVRVGVRAGVPEELLKQVASVIPEPSLQGQAQLEILRGRLASSKEKVPEEQAKSVNDRTVAFLLAWEAIARHNARLDGGTLEAVGSWEELFRPFGLVGAALGRQDGGR